LVLPHFSQYRIVFISASNSCLILVVEPYFQQWIHFFLTFLFLFIGLCTTVHYFLYLYQNHNRTPAHRIIFNIYIILTTMSSVVNNTSSPSIINIIAIAVIIIGISFIFIFLIKFIFIVLGLSNHNYLYRFHLKNIKMLLKAHVLLQNMQYKPT